MVARSRPDVPETAARAEATRLFHNLLETPRADPKSLPELISLPGRRGLAGLGSKDATALRILTLLVGVLLLLVCANVANLLLARSVDRERESAVRLALGAARSRLFASIGSRADILALLGGTAGLGLGYLLAQSLHMLFEAGRGPGSGFDLHISLRILGLHRRAFGADRIPVWAGARGARRAGRSAARAQDAYAVCDGRRDAPAASTGLPTDCAVPFRSGSGGALRKNARQSEKFGRRLRPPEFGIRHRESVAGGRIRRRACRAISGACGNSLRGFRG